MSLSLMALVGETHAQGPAGAEARCPEQWGTGFRVPVKYAIGLHSLHIL